MREFKTEDEFNVKEGHVFVIRMKTTGESWLQVPGLPIEGEEVKINDKIYRIKEVEIFRPSIFIPPYVNVGILVDE